MVLALKKLFSRKKVLIAIKENVLVIINFKKKKGGTQKSKLYNISKEQISLLIISYVGDLTNVKSAMLFQLR